MKLPHVDIGPELVPLCAIVLASERVSMHCAGVQASLARGHEFARSFHAQRRQERLHVALFAAVLAMGRSGGDSADRAVAAVAEYERRLLASLSRGALAESVVGLQIVLEGVGASLFDRFPAPPALAPIKRVVLAQEHGHHRLGSRLIAALRPADPDDLAQAARGYVDAGRSLLDASYRHLRRVGVEPVDPRASLPEWLSW